MNALITAAAGMLPNGTGDSAVIGVGVGGWV